MEDGEHMDYGLSVLKIVVRALKPDQGLATVQRLRMVVCRAAEQQLNHRHVC